MWFNVGAVKKYTYQEVHDYYNEHGCELLSDEYKNSKTKLRYRCKCGSSHKSSFEVFKKSNHCPKCTIRPTKYSYSDVKKYFEDNGCELLSKEYKNTKGKLDYICVCGEVATTAFERFKNGHRCKKCGRKKADNKLRHSYEDVKAFYKENKCKLLEENYNTVHDKMKFKCHCGNIEHSLTFKQFKEFKKCKDCYKINYYNLEKVKSIFKENDCEVLINKYINNSQEVEYICSCGNKEITTIHNYIHSKLKKCNDCVKIFLSESQSFDYSYVSSFFKENGCVLLSKEYKNAFQKLDFICSCGNQSKIDFTGFRVGHRCKVCGNKRTADAKRKSYDEVFNIFKRNGCLLLEAEYENSKSQPLKYVCKCGKTEEKTLYNFMKNPKCKTCTSEYRSSLTKGKKYPERSGENHPNWRFDLTLEEREKGRFFPEYKEWRLSVYERDSYTCQCCGDNKGGNLNAHHLDGYDWNIIDRFNVDNGMTLCDICHKDFHSIYGYGGNTKEQFEEYLSEILEYNKLQEM